jgi:hypothetical protein
LGADAERFSRPCRFNRLIFDVLLVCHGIVPSSGRQSYWTPEWKAALKFECGVISALCSKFLVRFFVFTPRDLGHGQL